MPGDFFDTNVLVYVASALHAGCDRLWTEDMQHGMKIEGRLTIASPFRRA